MAQICIYDRNGNVICEPPRIAPMSNKPPTWPPLPAWPPNNDLERLLLVVLKALNSTEPTWTDFDHIEKGEQLSETEKAPAPAAAKR